MKSISKTSEAVVSFYSAVSDEDRYLKGLGPLELERIKELILNHLKPKSVVLDIGGGTGVYSSWLSDSGHDVSLLDPVPKHIRKAMRLSSTLKKPFACHLGDARDLPFENESADFVMLHGPLYHLQLQSDRMKALCEAKRVCRKKGQLFAVAINRASFTLAGLLNGMIHDREFRDMCRKHLATGIHFPPGTGSDGFLPEAYVHGVSELENEVLSAGWKDVRISAVEGFSWLDSRHFQTMADPVQKKSMLSFLREWELDKELMVLSPHMVVTASK